MERELTFVGRRVAVCVAVAATLIAYGPARAEGSDVAAVEAGVVDVDATLGYQGESEAGTGIVLTSSGEILTNNHLIRGATSVRVTDLGNGRSYSSIVVGYDVAHDIAVLKLKGATGLKTVALGSSAGIKVGAAVTALGNAGGVGGSPSTVSGRIIGVGQSVTARDEDGTAERLKSMIETNALTEAGDSGGPLVDAAGRVIGINTASLGRPPGKGASVAYAIPITQALSIAHLIEWRHVTATNHIGPTPLLGIDVLTATKKAGQAPGVRINLVLPGSPAEKAGLVAGDVITAVAGHKVTSSATLTSSLLHSSPTETVAVVWINRAGRTHHGDVRLGTGPSQ